MSTRNIDLLVLNGPLTGSVEKCITIPSLIFAVWQVTKKLGGTKAKHIQPSIGWREAVANS